MAIHSHDHPALLTPTAGAAIVTLLSVLIVVVSILTQGLDTALMKENGGAEIASVAALVVLAGWMMLRWRDLGRFWVLPLVLVLFALRERDVHDWFYEPGLLHLGVLSGDNPLWQKAVTGIAIVAILIVLALVFLRGTGPFLRGLWQRAGWAWIIVAGLVCAALSLGLDGAGRRLASVGIGIGPELEHALAKVEELVELGFALSLVWATAAFLSRAPRV